MTGGIEHPTGSGDRLQVKFDVDNFFTFVHRAGYHFSFWIDDHASTDVNPVGSLGIPVAEAE